MQGFFLGNQNDFLFPLLIFSQCHYLSVSYVNGHKIINLLKEHGCYEIRIVQFLVCLFGFWYLQSFGVDFHLKWFVYSSISINCYAAEIITRSRVRWRTKLSFWSTSDYLLCKLGIVLNLLKCHILEARLSLTSQYKIAVSILSPTAFSPLIGFIFLYSSYHSCNIIKHYTSVFFSASLPN